MLVTKQAPEFSAEAVMEDGSFKKISLSDYRGKYVYLLFYPLDFTFVCPTEILAFNKKIELFNEKNCKVLGISIDSKFSHLAWRNATPQAGGIGKVNMPLIEDLTKQISKDYDVLLNDAVALRGLFLIDKQGVIQHAVINNLPLGRSVDEALRMLDALQYFESNGEVCPADWHKGCLLYTSKYFLILFPFADH